MVTSQRRTFPLVKVQCIVDELIQRSSVKQGYASNKDHKKSDVSGLRAVRWEQKEQWWLLPSSKIQHLQLSGDSLTQWRRVIVRESPGQLQTGEGAQPSSVPVTVLKRQRAARHEMAPMAEVLTHWARTAGRCPRQGICER